MARTCCCYSGYLSDFTFRSCRHIFLVVLPRNCRTSLKKCPLAAFCHMHMTPSHWNFEKKTHKTEMILIRTQSVKLTACSMTNLTSFLEPRCSSIEPKLFNIADTLPSFYGWSVFSRVIPSVPPYVCGVRLRQLCHFILQKEKLLLNDEGRRRAQRVCKDRAVATACAAKIRDFSGVRLRRQPIGGFFLTVLGC